MKAFILGVLFVVAYVGVLIFTLPHSPAVKKEITWHKECEAMGGIILPRTTMCIKKELVIEQDKRNDGRNP